MTFIEIEDAPADYEKVTAQNECTVKCSWCGKVIRLDAKELALAICDDCFDRMLADFVRPQTSKSPHASDR